ncbi:hypothetical protein FACS189427_00170 [Planctomycetales bacterium]|nr:hypothetical protein FACS189427_00170 [Planctomycetales bacterium]
MTLKTYISAFRLSLYLCFFPLFLSASETPLNNYFRDAEKEFAGKNYNAAYQLYSEMRDKLRDQNLPKERNRSLWLCAGEQIVRSLTAMNDNEKAAEEYFLLCRIEPLMSLDTIPLPWFVSLEPENAGTKPRETTAENILDPLQRQKQPSKTEQTTESPGAILLAAGILSVSNNPLKQQTGKQQLRQLAASLETEDPAEDAAEKNAAKENIPKEKNNLLKQRRQEAALLARVLLWKEQIPLLKTKNDLLPMKRLLEKISEPQRAGAYFLLGNAARQAGQQEEAVLFWMRVPVLYEHDRPLAAEALRETAAELKKMGRNGQAEMLLNKVP